MERFIKGDELKNRKMRLTKILGLIGAMVWMLTIFIRDSNIELNGTIAFMIGVAPNFGVGLLLPMLAKEIYSVVFKKQISCKQFVFILIGGYIALLLSEVIHDKFLNSPFDIYDMISSFIAFGIFFLLYRYEKKIECSQGE
ncbi:hypothetical protein [Maledivibacter halophilus]|uniref:VanZ like family protein n=1 Tax=Maledivibacter halophilus TaxID=36842 RepID=A0A1T5KD81_9FIRM|nr:hypothetical protein [Maledivibacter halophilus]SKC61651.1 hypothetical protein SAMN02194393_01703 [Maledivibacter halophilus]